MGSSRGYKTIRLTTHLLSLLVISANGYLFGYYFWRSEFFRIENKLNLGLVTLESVFKYTIILNIIMSLFSNCSINSKVSLFMKSYLVCGFLIMCFLVAFLIFTLCGYSTIFNTQYTNDVGTVPVVRFAIQANLNCTDVGEGSCTNVLKKLIHQMKLNYGIVAVFSLSLNFIIYVLVRLALMIDLGSPRPLEQPTMVRNNKIGYGSGSLRKRAFSFSDLSDSEPSVGKSAVMSRLPSQRAVEAG